MYAIPVAVLLTALSSGISPAVPWSITTPITAGLEGGPVIDSEEGKFRIELPSGFSEPTVNSTPVETAVGTLSMTTMTSAMGSNKICLIAYADYPESAVENLQDQRAVLNGAQSGALKNMKAKLISQKDIYLDSKLGRSFRFSMMAGKQKGYGQFNVFLVGPRLYQICFIGLDKKQLDKSEISAYFASFTLK